MSTYSLTPVLSMAASLGGAMLVGLASSNKTLRDGVAVLVSLAQFLLVASMVPAILSGQELSFTLSTFVPQVTLGFTVDALGLTFALLASFLWVVTTIYSVGYLNALGSPFQGRFHTCFALTMTATMGVAFAANLVTLYLFYEVMTLATYFLVAHEGTDEAHAGARKYVGYHLGTSIAFLLPAIILSYVVGGSFDFVSGGIFSSEVVANNPTLLTIIFCLFLLGSAKVALMPLHGWLPTAMVAPVPVSALLHAVAVVNAGAFGVLRVMFDVFGPEAMGVLGLNTITIWVSAFTIVVASLYALKLDSLKALLAYSTIGQLAYIVLGGALLNDAGMMGGILHIVNHGVSKITLFLCAGAIYVAAHRKYISEMGGLGRQMPITTLAFVVGACSMIGLPATAGFVSKWYLLTGSINASSVVALIALGLSTVLSAGYYLRAMGVLGGARAPSLSNHGPVGSSMSSVREPSWLLVGPLVATAGLTLLFGIFPEATLMPLVKLALPIAP